MEPVIDHPAPHSIEKDPEALEASKTALHNSPRWRNLVGHAVNHPETEPVLFFGLS